MSGLFIRLARQASGRPHNPVRAAVQMPYQPSPELFAAGQGHRASIFAQDIAQNGPDDRGVAPLLSTHEPQAAFSPAMQTGNYAGLDKIRGRPTGPDAKNIGGEGGMASEPQGGDDKSVTERPVESTPAGPEAVSSPLVDSTRSQVFDQAEAEASQLPSSTVASDKELEALSRNGFSRPESATHRQQTPPGETAQTESSAPQPLLPPLAVTPATNSMAASQTPPKSPESPNEVHVHIGRIEVTALQPAAASKAKPRAARQPMSLDDYLARRRQDRP